MDNNEQKVKLSPSNIIALIAVVITVFGGLFDVRSRQTEFNQRILNLEQANSEGKSEKEKLNVKLDRIIESINQIKVDIAGQRVEKSGIN
jgi:hypothetical protein